MNEELKREVSLQINYLGDSEYALGYSRAEKKDVATIVEVINKHRAQFTSGKTSNIGSAEFASATQWQALAAESDRAARDILLGSSSELAELDRLEKAALEAKRLADAKNRELESAWSEFSRIPERADKIKLELDGIAKLLGERKPETLEVDFKRHYKAMLNGSTVDSFT
jgi:hypothetical protein